MLSYHVPAEADAKMKIPVTMTSELQDRTELIGWVPLLTLGYANGPIAMDRVPHVWLKLRGSEPVDWARPLPDLSVERGGQDPLRKLEQHLQKTEHRVLLVAESAGRRESLIDLLRAHGTRGFVAIHCG